MAGRFLYGENVWWGDSPLVGGCSAFYIDTCVLPRCSISLTSHVLLVCCQNHFRSRATPYGCHCTICQPNARYRGCVRSAVAIVVARCKCVRIADADLPKILDEVGRTHEKRTVILRTPTVYACRGSSQLFRPSRVRITPVASPFKSSPGSGTRTTKALRPASQRTREQWRSKWARTTDCAAE